MCSVCIVYNVQPKEWLQCVQYEVFDDQWTTWLNIWLVLFMMFSLRSKTIFDVCTLMEYQKGHDIVMKMQSPFTMQYNIFLDWGAIIMPRFISANKKILFTQEKEIRTWKEQCFLLVWSSSSHLLFLAFSLLLS